MSSSFTSHLLVARRMQVAEPGQFLASYLKQTGENTAPPIGLPLDKLTAIGQETGVQGVFEGTVRDFDFTRGDPASPAHLGRGAAGRRRHREHRLVDQRDPGGQGRRSRSSAWAVLERWPN